MPLLRLAQLREAVPVLGDDQEVHRCLWIDVSEGQAAVVLIDDLSWDLLADDLVEDGGCALVRSLGSPVPCTSASRVTINV